MLNKNTLVVAQTTRFASFGPVLVIATHQNPSHAVNTYIQPKNHNKKIKCKKKNTLVMAQMTCFVVWILVIAPHLNPSRAVKT